MTKTILLAATLLMAMPAHATSLNLGSEEVGGVDVSAPTAPGSGPIPFYSWGYHYTLDFDGATLTKHIGVNFVFDSGFTPTEQAAFRSAAEIGVEQVWNNQYVLRDSVTNQVFPVAVDLRESGPYNQTVQVISGNGRGDMLHWYENYIASSPILMGHEFGHMLGLYDEYVGGALAPDLTQSNTGIMGWGALSATPEMLPRYYGEYARYMTVLNGDSWVLSSPVPEPSTWVFLLTGLLGLFFTRRWSNAATTSCPEVVSGLVDFGADYHCVRLGNYERATGGVLDGGAVARA